MAKEIEFSFEDVELKKTIKQLEKTGAQILPVLQKSVDWITAEIVTHAKNQHYFVGTGKSSSKIAEEHERTFTNPDGSPRFKSRTENLVNSIKEVFAKIKSGGMIEGKVKVGEKYAKDIEEGKGVRRRAFPFLRPAMEALRKPGLERMRIDVANFIKAQNVK